MNKNKLLGGWYGLVLGDACGVPFEFKEPFEIPPLREIEMVMPNKFNKTYLGVPYGTWSDDTSLAMCLLDALTEGGRFAPPSWQDDFVENMQNWRFHGKFTPYYEKKFDIGMQTAQALLELELGVGIQSRIDGPDCCGNGALMRSLPVALICYGMHTNTPEVRDATIAQLTCEHVHATHANMMSKVVSVAYALLAVYLLDGMPLLDALDKALDSTEEMFGAPGAREVDNFRMFKSNEIRGTGYSVDTFWSAIFALRSETDFKSTIQRSIAFGNDTDTTACVAGGLAGIIYGYDHLPENWLQQLRDKKQVDDFADRLWKVVQ